MPDTHETLPAVANPEAQSLVKPPARPLSYVPALIGAVGEEARKRFFTFFTDQIENENTRQAYHRNACRFFEWCEAHGLGFEDIESYHVAAYREHLLKEEDPLTGRRFSKASVKQHLATIRGLYDWLIVGQVLPHNPASAVRGPRLVVKKGKTPILDEEQAKELLASIDDSHVVGLRDRALIALMVYTFARVEAAVAMNVEDYFPNGKRWRVRLHEKGGKHHEMVCHHKLEEFLDAYIQAAGIAEDKKGPLFRSTRARSRNLTERRMHRVDAYRMVRRRALEAGIGAPISCHTFRGTGITNYLKNGGQLEIAQRMANHESARTTGLYDRRDDEVSLDEVERITI